MFLSLHTPKLRWKWLLMLLSVAGMAVVAGLYTRDIKAFFVDDTRYDAIIRAAAARHNVDSRLVRAVIFQESLFDPSARGSAGEIGLMQIMPSGAVADYARLHKTAVPSDAALFTPELNIEIGTWYLARALQRWKDYDCRMELALCQYNAGESRARAWKPESKKGTLDGKIDIDSTKNYVRKIMKRYRYYCEAPDA